MLEYIWYNQKPSCLPYYSVFKFIHSPVRVRNSHKALTSLVILPEFSQKFSVQKYFYKSTVHLVYFSFITIFCHYNDFKMTLSIVLFFYFWSYSLLIFFMDEIGANKSAHKGCKVMFLDAGHSFS